MLPSLAEPIVQATAQRLGSDFTGITRTDRGKSVRKNDARLEAVELLVIFHSFRREKIIGQICQCKGARREDALLSQIVNRQASWRWIEPVFGSLLVEHQGWHKRDLPVMNMDDVWPPVRIPRQMGDTLGEKYITLGVVRITDIVLQINS